MVSGAHMGMYIAIAGFLALAACTAGVAAELISIAKRKRQARKLGVAGDWMGAAEIYKQLMLENLEGLVFLGRVTRMARELGDLYRENDVEADVGPILDVEQLNDEISHPKRDAEETSALKTKLRERLVCLIRDLP